MLRRPLRREVVREIERERAHDDLVDLLGLVLVSSAGRLARVVMLHQCNPAGIVKPLEFIEAHTQPIRK